MLLDWLSFSQHTFRPKLCTFYGFCVNHIQKLHVHTMRIQLSINRKTSYFYPFVRVNNALAMPFNFMRVCVRLCVSLMATDKRSPMVLFYIYLFSFSCYVYTHMRLFFIFLSYLNFIVTTVYVLGSRPKS